MVDYFYTYCWFFFILNSIFENPLQIIFYKGKCIQSYNATTIGKDIGLYFPKKEEIKSLLTLIFILRIKKKLQSYNSIQINTLNISIFVIFSDCITHLTSLKDANST